MLRFMSLAALVCNASWTNAQSIYEAVETEIITLYFDTIVPSYLDQRVEGHPQSPHFERAVIYVDTVLGDIAKMTYGDLFCAYIMDDPWDGRAELYAGGCGDSTLKARPFDLDSVPSTVNRKVAPWSDNVDPTKIKVRARFSRILIDSAFNRAVFYGEIWCGGLCGEGAAWFIEKVDGQWRTRMKRRIWVS